MRRSLIVTTVTAALVAASASAATAAKPEQETLTLACENGQTIDVVVNGNGDSTPARALGSTTVAVPISVGDFSFRAVSPTGVVLDQVDLPGVAESKGQGNVAERNPRPTTTCSFSLTEVLTEPAEGFPAGTTLTFSGRVTVALTGRG